MGENKAEIYSVRQFSSDKGAWYDLEIDDDGDLVLLKDYQSIAQQRDALAAENAELNLAINKLFNWPGLEIYSYAWEFNNGDSPKAADLLSVETPATDAFTRELMAKGVESGADHFRSRAKCARGLGHHDRACFLDTTAEMFDEYAESLLKGINDAQ